MGRKSKHAFYAVARGKNPGIYADWASCEAQVTRVRDARFKSFATRAEAVQFIAENKVKDVPAAHGKPANQEVFGDLKQNSRKRTADATDLDQDGSSQAVQVRKSVKIKDASTARLANAAKGDEKQSPLANPEDCFTVVFTDGSSLGNGTTAAAAGIGIYFGPGDPRNVSERLADKQTNNRAELTAIIKTLQIVPSGLNVMIKTDSQYSISCFLNWHQAWARNGWRNSKNKPVENKDLIQRGLKMMQERSGKTELVKVKAHVGILGNEIADRLANEGAAKALEEEKEPSIASTIS